MKTIDIPAPKFSRFLFSDKRMAWFWLLVRLYVGWTWLSAGWGKLHKSTWVGSQAGTAIKGFFMGVLEKSSGLHPIVSNWYAWFIQHVALPHTVLFSYLITFGEFLVGIGLILGIFTGVAALFGGFMNMNFILAGAISINPTLLFLEFLLLLAWRIAGYFGLDRYIFLHIFLPVSKYEQPGAPKS